MRQIFSLEQKVSLTHRYRLLANFETIAESLLVFLRGTENWYKKQKTAINH
jgi:hypothetical protein